MLTRDQILYLLEELSYETILEASDSFRYRVQEKRSGYSDDKERGALQASLSIMLEEKTIDRAN